MRARKVAAERAVGGSFRFGAVSIVVVVVVEDHACVAKRIVQWVLMGQEVLV